MESRVDAGLHMGETSVSGENIEDAMKVSRKEQSCGSALDPTHSTRRHEWGTRHPASAFAGFLLVRLGPMSGRIVIAMLVESGCFATAVGYRSELAGRRRAALSRLSPADRAFEVGRIHDFSLRDGGKCAEQVPRHTRRRW